MPGTHQTSILIHVLENNDMHSLIFLSLFLHKKKLGVWVNKSQTQQSIQDEAT